jgi:hypothetical protein
MMDTTVLRGMDVFVLNGLIHSIQPTGSGFPPGTRVIDASGHYLMPGMAEMHAHVPGPQAPSELMENILFLYLANGVTTIRGMLGAPNQLIIRDEIEAGRRLGPRFIVGAPSINGNQAPDPETARMLVRQHKESGYDFLKLHSGLTPETYAALVEEARPAGITWAGHISPEVGLEQALRSRQSTVDHLDGYLAAVSADGVRAYLLSSGTLAVGEIIDEVDNEQLREIIHLTVEHGVWNVPTLYLWETFASNQPIEAFLSQGEMQFVPASMREGWANQLLALREAQRANGITDQDRDRHNAQRRMLIHQLAEAGAPILFGTDSPQIFNVPGFATHREIHVMAEAGLSPFQILESATINVARYLQEDLGMDVSIGNIAEGYVADLILVRSNPLDDARSVRDIAGVAVRGIWLDAAEISTRLEQIAASYR